MFNMSAQSVRACKRIFKFHFWLEESFIATGFSRVFAYVVLSLFFNPGLYFEVQKCQRRDCVTQRRFIDACTILVESCIVRILWSHIKAGSSCWQLGRLIPKQCVYFLLFWSVADVYIWRIGFCICCERWQDERPCKCLALIQYSQGPCVKSFAQIHELLFPLLPNNSTITLPISLILT